MSGNQDLTRAELIRRRRTHRTGKELNQTAKRSVKPMVPVTSRTSTMPFSSQPRLVAKPRRFNIALGLLPQGRLHKPNTSMLRFHANWRIVSILTALLLGAVIYLLLTLPYFFVPAATVLGNNRLSREEINQVLGMTGQSVFTVQPQDVELRLLMNYPELLSADVKVYLPNKVYVTVSERQPVILWQKGDGYTWIDDTGVAFRPRDFVVGLVPVIASDEPPAGIARDSFNQPTYMQKELADAILALAPLVPEGSTMTYDSVQGLGWTDSRGWQVSFGTNPNDIPLKIRVYQSLVDSLTASGKHPEYINVVYSEAPFYRMADNAFGDSAEEDTGSTGQ
ncbi:MAG: FtsQ-type POTRA domain-containing protein [Anaerolineaceae bacterium]|nr:MAG: FtsQ-type POTRA domain-containing protein [Anaerolineaceae bacterium]